MREHPRSGPYRNACIHGRHVSLADHVRSQAPLLVRVIHQGHEPVRLYAPAQPFHDVARSGGGNYELAHVGVFVYQGNIALILECCISAERYIQVLSLEIVIAFGILPEFRVAKPADHARRMRVERDYEVRDNASPQALDIRTIGGDYCTTAFTAQTRKDLLAIEARTSAYDQCRLDRKSTRLN